MSIEELKNKPLVEAILEFKWELPNPATTTFEGDPHYRLLLGRFSDQVQNRYPFHEPLQTSQVPDAMVLHIAQHRFRTAEGKWPLIQMGPGLMTVNETDGYTWRDFKQRCDWAVSILFDAHPERDTLKAEDLTLRYIDAVDVDFGNESVLSFLQHKMRTSTSLPDELFKGRKVRNHPSAYNWQASFPVDDLGDVALRFAMGKREDRQALIWETSVRASRERIPSMPSAFLKWVEAAHELIHDWFFVLIEGELRKRFSGE